MSLERPRPVPATTSTFQERRRTAWAAVLGDFDLLALVLRGNVGPITFLRAASVSKAWRHVCHHDPARCRAVRGHAVQGPVQQPYSNLFVLPPERVARLMGHF